MPADVKAWLSDFMFEFEVIRIGSDPSPKSTETIYYCMEGIFEGELNDQAFKITNKNYRKISRAEDLLLLIDQQQAKLFAFTVREPNDSLMIETNNVWTLKMGENGVEYDTLILVEIYLLGVVDSDFCLRVPAFWDFFG